MKLAQFTISLFYSISHLGSRNAVLGSSFYSTKIQRFRTKARRDSLNQLYRRITPVGDPKVSIVPILDQWIEEGNPVNKYELQVFIREFRYYKRYSHALEISMWMTDKRYFDLSLSDIAIRLDLISKVHGIEQVEKYFNNIPQKLKVLEVYGALLNCYAYAKSVEKAEAVFQKMRDLGFARASLNYNVMLNLYYQTGNIEKFEMLIQEMEEKDIAHDCFTSAIRLTAYAASNIERMEKTMKVMECDAKVDVDWTTYAVAAKGYTKAGLLDKAFQMLKKSEGLITTKRSRAYNHLITQYAAIGKKDEVLRLWELYKKKEKVFNSGYICILSSVLKFNDIESAEKIFEEWESRNLEYDMRVPNFLIGAYSREGLLERAETLVNKALSKGGKPDAVTWYHLATGYLRNDQFAKAVELMKKALVVSEPWWKPSNETLASCLEHLKGERDWEKVEEFLLLLLDHDIISLDVKARLLNHMKADKPNSDAICELHHDSLVQHNNMLQFLDAFAYHRKYAECKPE